MATPTTEFELMPTTPPVHSATAAASLSIDDVNFDGVKHHDVNKVDPKNRMITYAIAGAASLGLVLGLVSMYIEMSLVVFVAFAFPLVTAPAVIIQRRKIQWLPTFREEHNKLRLSVHDFAMANNRLSNENGRLERQVSRMQAVEERFEHIIKRERKDVNRVRDIVRQNGAIQREMKKLQAAKDLQLLFELVLKSDRNEDEKISDEDMDRFIIRVRAIYGKNHRVFNEDNIRQAFKSSMNKTTHGLLEITASMMEDTNQPEEPVVETLQKVPSRAMEETLQKVPSQQYQQPETVERIPTADLIVYKVPTEDPIDVPAEVTAYQPPRQADVRSTGLVVPNSESMKSEGVVPRSLYGAVGVDPTGRVLQHPTDDMLLLNGLLSSNSRDFDAASMRTDDAFRANMV